MSSETLNSLQQQRPWKKINHLELKENRCVRIETSKPTIGTMRYMIDIIALNEKSSRRLVINWMWFVLTIVFGVVGYGEMTLGLLKPIGDWYSLFITGLFFFLAVISLVGLWKFSYSKSVFTTRHAHVPLLEVWGGKPSGKKAREFISALKKMIELSHERAQLSNEQQLTGEMKMLRRLVDENIIPQPVYDKARDKLLKKF